MSDVVNTLMNGGVFEISLNRPKQLNALNIQLLEKLTEAVNEAQRNETVRCVVIRGEGRHFMAGGDIAYFF